MNRGSASCSSYDLKPESARSGNAVGHSFPLGGFSHGLEPTWVRSPAVRGWQFWYPQFARCIAPGPSSHSLTRYPQFRLPGAPLNVPPKHAVLRKGQSWVSAPLQSTLESAEVIFGKRFTIATAQIFPEG